MRAITASIMVLACCAFLWLLWDTAWKALTNLPGRAEIREASSAAVAVASRTEPAPQRRSAPAQTAAPPATEPQRQRSNVRFVEKDGIVGIHVDGPLERAPAAVKEEPPPPPPKDEPDVYRLVVIESAGVIDVRSHKVQLVNVEAPVPEATCRNANGTTWPCGMRARTAMRRLIRRRTIECTDPKPESQPVETADAGATRTDAAPPRKGEVRLSSCKVGPIDLSEWLLENGWAAPTDAAPEAWRALHAEAREAGRGLYATNGR